MGIIADLSEWQGSVDFAQLKGQVDGVILRCQHGYTHTDKRYKEYVAGCKENGIPFGTYAYFAAVSVNDAIAEANNALKLVDPESKCFAVDMEEMTMTDLVSGGQTFADTLKAAGIKNVGIYSYKGFYDAHNLQAIQADWHWIAAYGINDGQPHIDPAIVGETLWQFTSVGHLSGISGNVDESKEIGFTFFNASTVIAKFVMTVKVLCQTDVRDSPSHNAGYIQDVHKDEVYNVIQIKNDWHQVALTNSTTGWIDGNNGQNLYWLDNPNLTNVSKQTIYIVQPGDTLSKISAKYGYTVNDLAKKNGLKDPNLVYAGQMLYV